MAVIKGNKYNNIPAVLIEHCFISNASDCEQFLSSEEKLRTLGVADANGIMDYLGLNNLKQASDGNWYFYKNGATDYSYTGLALYSGNWWYVKNGKIDFNANTLAYFKGNWWYVRNGRADFNANTLAYYNKIWWYVKEGQVDFNVITDNQWFGTVSTGVGCISISGICLNASLYLLYMSVFCFILKSITFNCPLPIPAVYISISYNSFSKLCKIYTSICVTLLFSFFFYSIS